MFGEEDRAETRTVVRVRFSTLDNLPANVSCWTEQNRRQSALTFVISPLARARICSPIGRKSQARDRADSAPPVMCPLCFRDTRVEDATSTAARRLDCSDVDLFHLHHRIERALGGSGIGIGDRFRQGDRRNLPGQSPFVLAPAARALLAAVADDRVPVAIRFGLVSGCDLKRERFVVLER